MPGDNEDKKENAKMELINRRAIDLYLFSLHFTIFLFLVHNEFVREFRPSVSALSLMKNGTHAGSWYAKSGKCPCCVTGEHARKSV